MRAGKQEEGVERTERQLRRGERIDEKRVEKAKEEKEKEEEQEEEEDDDEEEG